MLGSIRFNRLSEGDIAYRQGQQCQAYVMCIDGRRACSRPGVRPRNPALSGRTRRDLRTHHVLPHGRASLPRRKHSGDRRVACGVASPCIPPAANRLGPIPPILLNNYGDLLSSLITLVDEVAFASLDLRLARRLIAEADERRISSLRSISAARARLSAAISRVGADGLGPRVTRQHRGARRASADKLWRPQHGNIAPAVRDFGR